MVEVLRRYSSQDDLSSAVGRAWELVQRAPGRQAPSVPASGHVHKLVQRLSDSERRAIVEAYVAGASERLLDLAADDALPRDKVRQRLRDVKIERERLQAARNETSADLAHGAKIIGDALDLLVDPSGAYERMPDRSRRLLNETFFHRLYVDEEGISGSSQLRVWCWSARR